MLHKKEWVMNTGSVFRLGGAIFFLLLLKKTVTEAKELSIRTVKVSAKLSRLLPFR